MLGSGHELAIHQVGSHTIIQGLPTVRPETLYPIIELLFERQLAVDGILACRNWSQDLGNWQPFAAWVESIAQVRYWLIGNSQLFALISGRKWWR